MSDQPQQNTVGRIDIPEATGSGCPPIFQLADYVDPHAGPVTESNGAQVAFKNATTAAKACGGGVVAISPETTPDFQVTQSSDGITVIDARRGRVLLQAPTIGEPISGGDGYPKAGLLFRRTLEEHPGLNGVYSTQATLQRNVHGGTSLKTALLPTDSSGLAVKAGSNARWYPISMEGIFVGQQFVVDPSGMSSTVKAMGWDDKRTIPAPWDSSVLTEAPAPYFTADASADIAAGSVILNKDALRTCTVISEDHCANQSPALSVEKYSYGQGDAQGCIVLLYYQGNILSSMGDEGGQGFAVDVVQDLRFFRATVQSFTSIPDRPPVDGPPADGPATELGPVTATATLTYSGAENTERLGTCRPIINLGTNPSDPKANQRWITSGKVRIYISNTYPATHPNTGLKGIAGGVVQGIGTSWTPNIVGRYFAVDEPSEYLDPGKEKFQLFAPPALARRWFRIAQFLTDPDPTNPNPQLLSVHTLPGQDAQFSGAPPLLVSAPPLMNIMNYYNYNPTAAAELDYIIAPGGIVSDVRQGVNENDSHIVQNTLALQPTGDGKDPTFVPGDQIEQAVGPQPWNPMGFRVRHLNNFPCIPGQGEFSFYSENIGTAPVQFGLALQGHGHATDVQSAKQFYPRGGVAYGTGVAILAVTDAGLTFDADVRYHDVRQVGADFVGEVIIRGFDQQGNPIEADEMVPANAGLAIVFNQTGGEDAQNLKVLAWTRRARSPEGVLQSIGTYATFGFDSDTHEYFLRGARAVQMGRASLTEVKGLSASNVIAQNLRGINEHLDDNPRATWADPKTRMKATIQFPLPERDDSYAIQVVPNWLTTVAATAKTNRDFTLQFGASAPQIPPATVDWFLVR
jgi:hypothetical protein